MSAHIVYGLIIYLLLVISLSLREWARGIAAYKLGDNTPLLFGRLTLNPLVHIDLLGTVIIPLSMILLLPGFIIFGWAKPVPINVTFFKNKNISEVLIAMAGPLMNLLLAVISAFFGVVLAKIFGERIGSLFGLMMWVNLMLFVFNLIPIPPLDGSYIVKFIFQISDLVFYNLSRFGFFILIILINVSVFRVFIVSSIIKIFNLISVVACGLFEVTYDTLIPF